MPQRKEIESKVTKIIFKVLKMNDESHELPNTTRLHEDMQMDSFAFVQLHMAIEDVFGIRINPDRTDVASAFNTIASLTDMVLLYYLNPNTVE